MKLLIVEDSWKMREMLKSIFKTIFNEIRECEDGETSLQEYESFSPDWVFMDIEMKKVDGITASKEILKLHPQAKIVIITSHNDPHIKEDVLSLGVYKFIWKGDILCLLDMFEKI